MVMSVLFPRDGRKVGLAHRQDGLIDGEKAARRMDVVCRLIASLSHSCSSVV